MQAIIQAKAISRFSVGVCAIWSGFSDIFVVNISALLHSGENGEPGASSQWGEHPIERG